MKKLIPAICMTLIAAVMLASSTFAWFSLNTSVTAEGMQVTAQSNSVYLLISEASELSTIQGANSTKVMYSGSTALFPSAHKEVTNTSEATTLSNWYYKTADAPTAATSSGSEKVLSNFGGYVLRKTVYIAVAAGSNTAEELKVSATITAAASKTITPIMVLVTTSSAVAELSSATPTSDVVLAATISNTDVIAVDIFIYYDGNNADVYTNNIENLDGATIKLTFSVKAA
ncbi:MAG: hypothetical protein PUB81_02795 [Clostridiales bacterium]|nr:hypothetical protein [Clostridiales bacterium]